MTSEPASKKHERDTTSDSRSFVNFIVGGRYFSIRSALFAQYPESYFSSALKKEWRNDEDVINIDRDGSLFEYIVDFHNYGVLHHHTTPLTMDEIKAIQDEADFYNMAKMVEACNEFLVEQIKKHNCSIAGTDSLVCSKYDEVKPAGKLVLAIQDVWTPACYCGKLVASYNVILKGIPSIVVPNIEALTPGAQQTDHCKSIDAALLGKDALRAIETIFPSYRSRLTASRAVQQSPWQVLLVSQGESVGDMFQYSAEENSAGTLLFVVNSDFEGGELVVNHNSKTLTMSKQYEYIMLANGCPYEHKVVTSGTQVLLVLRATYLREKESFEIYTYDFSSVDDYLWEDLEEYNKTVKARDQRTEDGISQPLSPSTVEKLHAGLTEELATSDAIVISLTHYYPIMQCTPDCLTHGDAVLYAVVDSFLQSEAGSAFELSLALVSLDHLGTDFDPLIVVGSVKDLNFASSKGIQETVKGKENVKLLVSRSCDSKVFHRRNDEYSKNTFIEYIVLGLKIAKKRDA